MKKFLIPVSLYLLILLGLSACIKDKGNYDYIEANAITITTDMAKVDPLVVINNDSVVIRQNDSLKIDILLTQTAQVSDDLSYQWFITQTAASFSNPVQYVIGTEKQLRAKILLSPNLYRLVVKVTDNKTGVSFYKFYNLNVDTPPWGGEGWLVLQDQTAQGGCDFSIITTRDGVARGTVYSNLYSLANAHKLPEGINKIAVMNYGNQLRIQKVAFYSPNEGIQVRSVDYWDSSNHEGWFFVPPSPINIQSNAVGTIAGQYEVLINNGLLYVQAVNLSTIKTPPIKFGAPLLGSWPSLSPYFMFNANGGYCTFYDKVNKCFLHINMSNNTLVPSLPDNPNQHWAAYSGAAANLHPLTGKGYDLNNIGRDLIYSENAQMTEGAVVNPIYYCIFRNSAKDSTFLYQFTSNSTGIKNDNSTGRYYLKDAATHVPGINSASLFAVPAFSTSAVSNVLYYVPGGNANQIYVCNPSYTGTMPATTTAHSGYSFPAGTIIKAMKVFKSGFNATNVPNTEGKVLVVATDETVNGNGHNVYFFKMTNTGEFDNTATPQVYTGFDKILDIAFKKGLGS
ncbi:PKD-like family lipoprotein [Chitinophagaceae bacterium LB-8]|uniref:PKD-like family lipoprotein n=1 Tax=Paraflavisolibacter caeni TaxID=2982496 RepID=A0A9X2XUG8_9BACT|nr:PKD-like family lipoprotein [Paraflavisolibacter caeni]MCU7548815.1 PKD-like family lipoprotein [Paraflavisolibacter caeni]